MLHSVTSCPIWFLMKLELGCKCLKWSHAECADCKPDNNYVCETSDMKIVFCIVLSLLQRWCSMPSMNCVCKLKLLYGATDNACFASLFNFFEIF